MEVFCLLNYKFVNYVYARKSHLFEYLEETVI